MNFQLCDSLAPWYGHKSFIKGIEYQEGTCRLNIKFIKLPPRVTWWCYRLKKHDIQFEHLSHNYSIAPPRDMWRWFYEFHIQATCPFLIFNALNNVFVTPGWS